MVNTVTGPIPADRLGMMSMHEHFAFGWPGFASDMTNNVNDYETILALSIDMARRLKKHGLVSVLDATANDCGRDPELLKKISEASGIQIVCSTGLYREETSGASFYYRERSHFLKTSIEAEISETMIRELTDGIGKTNIKAGVIKVASSEEITPFETHLLRAGAAAQKATGRPIITHIESGMQVLAQARTLLDAGANPAKTVIGHVGAAKNIDEVLAVLDMGFNLGFDRFGTEHLPEFPMDERREVLLLGLAAIGYAKQMVIGQDSLMTGMYGRMRPSTPTALFPEDKPYRVEHLFNEVIPELKKSGLSEAALHTMMVENPCRIFGD